ncbi:MAG TPA: hypothetical protein DHV93_11405 [Holophagaceae bacterium]|nr:hypothetical protein [Holophagaceae bacterium]
MYHTPMRCLSLAALVTLAACGGGGGSSTPPPPSAVPAISAVSPNHGTPGARVALSGTNLLGATAVSFNGRPAFSYSVVSASQIDAVVPSNATTGTIRVTTPDGFATSPSFTVDATQAPIITSFTPTALSANAAVTLSGAHFVGASQVQFNGLNAASFKVASDTEIQATAPIGLTAGAISVTTPGGTATSATSYIVSSMVQVLMNSDFEQASPIIWAGDTGVIQETPAGQTSLVPRSGSNFAWLGGYGSVASDQITQDLYIPASTTAATATFYFKIITAEPAGGGAKDSGIIEALSPSGTLLGTLLTKTNLDAGDYTASTVDLLPYKGQVVRLSFRSLEDSQNATSFLLDDATVNLAAPAADLRPVITSFTPSSGTAGETSVQITGGNFFGVTGITLGGVSAAYTLTDGTRLTAALSSSASIGSTPITITNTQGTGTSTSAFQVAYGQPAVASLYPTQGPVGTPVTILGSYLGYPGTGITLNGQAVALTSQSASKLTFAVPAGATTGNLVLTTPGGQVTQTFTVNQAASTLDLHIEKVQLTQSTQTLDNSVPIVAGKDGLIRVFVLANQTNTAAPSVRVMLLNNGQPVAGYPKILAAPGSSTPLAVDESLLSNSWNLAVPGVDLTTPSGTGYSILADVDSAGAVAEADETNNSASMTLASTTVPVFRTTIFPVALASGTGNITEQNKAAWTALLAQMYPVSVLDVQVGATFTSSATLLSDGTGWDTLLNELAAKHYADNVTNRYYYGALHLSYTSGVVGLGYVPYPDSSFKYRTAIGWDYSTKYASTFAHETGHNMGRHHSPCGGVEGADPAYPYAGGVIGAWGYDTTTGLLKSPTTYKDIMGYCSPLWVSDYVYKGILDFRNATNSFLKGSPEDAPMAMGSATSQECLIVRGLVYEDGRVEFLPSFRTTARPSSATTGGEYTLEGLDPKGGTLFHTALDLAELGCWPKGRVKHFVMALPMDPAKLDLLEELRVVKDGKIVAGLSTTPAVAATPEVQRLSADKVQLTWDATLQPAVMVRDGDTGEVVAILSGGRQAFSSRAQRFDLALSQGAGGRTVRVALAE